MFSAQKSLLELDLADNLLSDLEDGAFFGMDSLTMLNLTSNQVNYFCESSYLPISDKSPSRECVSLSASASFGFV